MHIPKIKIFLTSSLTYHKEQRYYKLVSVLWACLAKPIKKMKSICKFFFVYQNAKNQLNYSFLSWDFAKILDTYFDYFRHAWSCPSNIVASICRKLWYLSASKVNFTLHFFLEILQLFSNLLCWALWT